MHSFLRTLAYLTLASMAVIYTASTWVDHQHSMPAATPIDYPEQDN